VAIESGWAVPKTEDQVIVADLETKMAPEHWKAYLLLHTSNMAVVVVLNVELAFHENCGLVSYLKGCTIYQ
jgi:hypothetical protein